MLPKETVKINPDPGQMNQSTWYMKKYTNGSPFDMTISNMSSL